jgi:hypothetical protein
MRRSAMSWAWWASYAHRAEAPPRWPENRRHAVLARRCGHHVESGISGEQRRRPARGIRETGSPSQRARGGRGQRREQKYVEPGPSNVVVR